MGVRGVHKSGEGGIPETPIRQNQPTPTLPQKTQSQLEVDASQSVPSVPVVSQPCPSVLGQFQHTTTKGGNIQFLRVLPLILYLRYSSNLQRKESCDDQERIIRTGLNRKGIDHRNAEIIKDEALTGTKESRKGYSTIVERIKRGDAFLLATDDQSRLSRGDTAKLLIKDLVFSGGRFVSLCEGIDTKEDGWELRVGIMEIHNSQTIRELGRRVRRGQEGRVLDACGSAGDYCFGYRSRYLEPHAHEYRGRGPRPKKVVFIYRPEAKWVVQICIWFLRGRSARWIAHELNRLGIQKPPGSMKPHWYPELVRRILSNSKYIGQWAWGTTRTIRDAKGRKKQVPVPRNEQVHVHRPELRIVEQDLWDKVQAKLAEAKDVYGYKPGQKRRGPKVHHTQMYPNHILGGLLFCAYCGARLHREWSKPRWYYSCPTFRNKGKCHMRYRVPEGIAEPKLLEFLSQWLQSVPGWLDRLYEEVCATIKSQADAVPEELAEKRKRMSTVKKMLGNLVESLGMGSGQPDAVTKRIVELESEGKKLEQEVKSLNTSLQAPQALPGKAHVRSKIVDLARTIAKEDVPEVALLLRRLIGKIRVLEIIPKGKKRGYGQLLFTVNPNALIKEALDANLRSQGITMEVQGAKNRSEIRLTLGGPTRMDTWAPKIAKMREEGVPWKRIAKITGLGLGNACTAHRRWLKAEKVAEVSDSG